MGKRVYLSAKLKEWISFWEVTLFKTTKIGRKLLRASRTNAHLKETYESLGRYVELNLKEGTLKENDPKIKSLMHTIEACKKDLVHLENQVNKIRFSQKEGLV
jgi:hypothetical protein